MAVDDCVVPLQIARMCCGFVRCRFHQHRQHKHNKQRTKPKKKTTEKEKEKGETWEVEVAGVVRQKSSADKSQIKKDEEEHFLKVPNKRLRAHQLDAKLHPPQRGRQRHVLSPHRLPPLLLAAHCQVRSPRRRAGFHPPRQHRATKLR